MGNGTQPDHGSQSVEGRPARQGWTFFRLLALASITAIWATGSVQTAAAQEPGPLRAYLGYSDKKPDAQIFGRPGLAVSQMTGTASYAISTPRSSTGITLVVSGDLSSKATAGKFTTPEGKKLKRKLWSTKLRDERMHILAFDGLGFGANAIEISVNVPKKPELAKTFHVTVTRAETLGSDPTLTSIELSESGLRPRFSNDVRSYVAVVPYRVSALGVTARSKEAGTVVRLSGTASDGTALVVNGLMVSELSVGKSTIKILATAEDSLATETYTITAVRQRASRETKLRDLSMAEGPAGFFGLDIPTGGGILQPAFSSAIRSYEATVPSTVTAVKMAVLSQTIAALGQGGRAADGTALAVRSSDLTVDSMKIGDITVRDLHRRIITFGGLQAGGNTIDVEVTAEDGVTTGTYTVTVTRDAAP